MKQFFRASVSSLRKQGRIFRSLVSTVLTALLVTAVAACGSKPPQSAPVAARQVAAPPMPLYQMRAEMPAGDRLDAGRDGEALFSNRCGSCHLPGGMGSNLLTKQRVALGESPERGLLSNRDDLDVDYIKLVAREGKMAMPRLSKVEVSDAELESIAHYLARTAP